jgi:uncharacterized protein YidB (DUF937 family)
MYKKILVTGGVVSSLLLTGAATTFAQTGMMNQVKDTRPMHRMITGERIADMATKLGLNADEIQKELDAGKKLPDILQQHNITKEQMENIFPHPQPSDKKITDIATKFGLDAAVIRQELATGKKLPEILKAHNITDEQLKTVFGERKGGFGKGRGMMMLKMSPEILQVQASILGLPTEELQTAFKNRETLKSIVEAKGLTMETFHQKVNEQIKQMISDGKITGTQAELLQKMIEHKGKMPRSVNNNNS